MGGTNIQGVRDTFYCDLLGVVFPNIVQCLHNGAMITRGAVVAIISHAVVPGKQIFMGCQKRLMISRGQALQPVAAQADPHRYLQVGFLLGKATDKTDTPSLDFLHLFF